MKLKLLCTPESFNTNIKIPNFLIVNILIEFPRRTHKFTNILLLVYKISYIQIQMDSDLVRQIQLIRIKD